MRTWLARFVAIAGIALLLAAATASQSWLDRHFLPSFFVPRSWYVGIESAARAVIASIGLGVAVARFRIVQVVMRAPSLTWRVIAAALLAVGASEYAARWVHLPAREWLLPAEEPRREADAQLGWVLAPSRTGYQTVGGRPITYAIDAAGYRVRRADEPVDPRAPALVFAGESVMFGEGLTWDESIPAQVGAMIGIPSANLAVHGYGSDQIYLRLARELPKFRYPVAVVSIFMTELFGRNLDGDRPHLVSGLTWVPAEKSSRLLALASILVPYRRAATVEQGIAVTREILDATVQLARDRAATSLIVVPRFGAEDAVLRTLRERVITADMPVVIVPLDPGWRLPWDRHPNAHAAHAVAAAIATRLRRH